MASSLMQATISSGDLVDLISSSGSATIYPNDDTILAVLHARFRADLPYTHIGASNLVAINPYKTLANLNDASAKEYEERSYKDTSLPMVDSPRPLQPHLYDLAAKVYLLMRRRVESQAVIARGITGSGKTASVRLFVDQIIRLSTHSSHEAKVAEQVKAMLTVLDAFGNAKTLMNANASRHSRYIELHFNDRGRLCSAKVLAYGLDKSRINRLSHEERSFHIFYQLLAGATSQERDQFNLEDPSDYALLASSGCYRLPSGPFSDDATAMIDLRACMKTLGFKPKHFSAIFNVLVGILLLSNIQFAEGDASDVSAYIVNTQVLEQAARLLGVPSEDLNQILTNKTNYVRKEMHTVLLNAHQSAAQRDQFMRDLYAILFAFVVETGNHKIAPSSPTPPHTQIAILDIPGFQSRGPVGSASISLSGPTPLVSAYGQNGFDEFCINFADEVLQSYIVRNIFEDKIGYNKCITDDGVPLPAISTMNNSGCVELLKGIQMTEKAHRKPSGILGVLSKACSSYKSGKSSDQRNEDLLQDLVSKYGVHASFVASPSVATQDQNLFGINHYAGSVSYDVANFVEKDADLLDSAFVSLLRTSSNSFVARLLAGPSLAIEKHPKDEQTIVQAQVSTRPLRQVTPVISIDGTLLSEEPSRLDIGKMVPVTTQLNYTLFEVFTSIDRARLWTISCFRPNDSGMPNSFDKRRVKSQIRSLLLADFISRRSIEFVVDFGHQEFCDRYVPTMRGPKAERIEQCARANGWREGLDYVLGTSKVWLAYPAWKMVENDLRAAEKKALGDVTEEEDRAGLDDRSEYTQQDSTAQAGHFNASVDNLLARGPQDSDANGSYAGGGPLTPNSQGYADPDDKNMWGQWNSKEGHGSALRSPLPSKEGAGMIVHQAPNAVEEVPSSKSRRIWLWVVRGMTWWLPSFILRFIGRMKRPDVRLAWREKTTIFILIFILNAIVVFYIVEFGRLLCPNFDKAWSTSEVARHTGTNDFWVAIRGQVYDVSNFVNGDHSDIGLPSNGADTLDVLAGQDLTNYFPPPLVLACTGLVTNNQVGIGYANFTPIIPSALHVSGGLQPIPNTKLRKSDWYTANFLLTMRKFHKGPLVYEKKAIMAGALDQDFPKQWAVYEDNLYDLTDYIYTLKINQGATALYSFLDSDIVDLFKQQMGQDITAPMNAVLAQKSPTVRAQNLNCLRNAFHVGQTDFRKTTRCQAQNYLLLIFSGIIVASMTSKFLAALQLNSKRSPELLDKFVICQVPCYTEGEDSLRRTIDSLAALHYDDKRKLLFIICDGNITGSGNDRTTPRIVLDILGIDPKLDPEPLLFKSVGEGSKALNYGKVYSGLYEFEGHVVPYMVVIKVGKPSERSKPGNRGKRDSQILLLHYLNRVHFDAPMSPLELEIYHQMRNVIGIDPAFYEYIFTVDADTIVTPESLNRLVASAADDSSIIGICGETKLQNEEGSWWTMIQVYEYYISHHLSKAFESLFGSVTCLPGCFSLYRIRTADKGRPIIISNRIIDEYAEPNVDTLHKKNLFSLGEDRYLTTLLMKHFPTFKTKFIPDAVARTTAPESWRILFSQRRRWINSTVHNLCELALLPELFGFCCFSMRFFVFIDLLSTLILPATVVYLFYLIIMVSFHKAAFPQIAIIMLAAAYGFQAIIFVIKREFMLIGWMIVYILSYPVYSFFLPVYSFWCMDEFGWGNTRVVIGEGSNKKIVINEDERFDESMIPLKKFSEYEAEAWEAHTHHSEETGYDTKPHSQSHSRAPPSRPESPHNYHQASQSGDYYRDTNLTQAHKSNSNVRLAGSQFSHSNNSHRPIPSQPPPVSQYAPQLVMPIGGGFGSLHGSDAGHAPVSMPQMTYPNAGSIYGMLPGLNVSNPLMPNMSMFGVGSGSQSGHSGVLVPPTMPAAMQERPISTFSVATTAGPSFDPNPTDDDLYLALRNFLSTQDLMTVTKKTAREAIIARYPKADLTSRKDFLNQSIDRILSES